MHAQPLSRYVAALGVAIALLAACGGSQPPIGSLGAVPETSASRIHVERDGSWMLPEAKGDDLLYVSTTIKDLCGFIPAR